MKQNVEKPNIMKPQSKVIMNPAAVSIMSPIMDSIMGPIMESIMAPAVTRGIMGPAIMHGNIMERCEIMDPIFNSPFGAVFQNGGTHEVYWDDEDRDCDFEIAGEVVI